MEAPLKDFVYVVGSFNNWTPTAQYAMKKDPNSDLFPINIGFLTNQQSLSHRTTDLSQRYIQKSTRMPQKPNSIEE